ncbi:WxL protein peptidoglycan domain-containing protein [Yinghuangia seranimata]|uniref:WxL protein peptidoglycan domain-containing protein n=1 Tax=Yinghuangia seranimata TaxID=408067 RepID=UPI00248BE669|nr:DUF916 domain-containing protein [Yinghuangia seranimata]MDI2132291.1 DUF916 domain-containing protein [Yinghuangia seranimata]
MTVTGPAGGTPALRDSSVRSRIGAVFIALLVAMASWTVLPAPAAHAIGNSQWSIDPLVTDANKQNDRRYFFLDGAPGTTVSDVAVLSNTSDHDMTFKLFGSDAYNTPRDGAFGIRQITDQQTDVGLWLKVAGGQTEVTLKPNQQATIPFTITIPPNARPGDHAGAMTALNTEVYKREQKGDFRVDEQMQIGARIYLRVAGDALPGVEVRDVRVERSTGFGDFFGSDKAVIHYTVVNRGNVMITPSYVLKADGLFGKLLNKTSTAPEPLLPGQSVELSQVWNDAPLMDHVSVSVKVISQSNGQKLEDSESTSYTAVPWPALVTLAFLLVVAGFAWSYLRNRRAKGGSSGGDGAKPKKPDTPGDNAADEPNSPAKKDKKRGGAGGGTPQQEPTADPAGVGG